jgi:hypothetical protein
MVSCLKVMLKVLFAWNNNKKGRHVMNTRKHMILLKRKANLTEKLLWHYELTNKTETGWNKKIKKLWRHDQTEVVIFWQNKNKRHSATVVQFPFDQPSHKSFCRNIGLCWGSWPCLPSISSGWVNARVWTKMMVGWKELPQSYISVFARVS